MPAGLGYPQHASSRDRYLPRGGTVPATAYAIFRAYRYTASALPWLLTSPPAGAISLT